MTSYRDNHFIDDFSNKSSTLVSKKSEKMAMKREKERKEARKLAIIIRVTSLCFIMKKRRRRMSRHPDRPRLKIGIRERIEK